MTQSFTLRADERGFEKILSTGPSAAYVGGHPDAFVTRASSFNFADYQSGRAGFGRIRVFGEEAFHNPGCGYSMHPHHNFIICAFVLKGRLLHVNTMGDIDELSPGDFYAFSAGSGGLHSEMNLHPEPMQVIYLWMLPDHLLLPPSYARSHFDAVASMNRIVPLIGHAPGALSVPQDATVSRLMTDRVGSFTYKPRSRQHGVYAFVLEGEILCDGTLLGHHDSKGIWDAEAISCQTGTGNTDVLLVETVL